MVLIAACSVGNTRLPYRPSTASTARGQVIYVVRRSWHIDLEFPAADLVAPLAAIESAAPAGRYLGFGFGDRHYLVEKNRYFPGLLAALWPGPGVILVGASDTGPSRQFGADHVVAIMLSREHAQSAQAFIWSSLAGRSGPLSPSALVTPVNGFYFAAVPEYSALYTCNTWAAQVLAAAGLPIHPSRVIFADQLWSQVLSLGAERLPVNDRGE